MTKLSCALPALALLLSACAGSETAPASATWEVDPRPLGKTLVYECQGPEFIARVGPGEMTNWLDDRYLVLTRLRRASAVDFEEAD